MGGKEEGRGEWGEVGNSGEGEEGFKKPLPFLLLEVWLQLQYLEP